MAKIFTDIKAKDFFSGKSIKLEIITNNSGEVLSIHPSSEDRKTLLMTEETVTLPKRIWNKIPYAFKYWDVKNNIEPNEKEKNP